MDRTWLRLVYLSPEDFGRFDGDEPLCWNCGEGIAGKWAIEDPKDGLTCDTCARPHAPELVLAREVANSSHALARATEERMARETGAPF